MKKKEYTASIKILGKLYTSTGATLPEALDNLEVPKARGVSVLNVSLGKKSQSKILTPFHTTRLFSPQPFTKEITIKNVSARFSI